MTFYHHVEEMSQVDYRYHKTFNGRYTDNTGNTLQKEYGLFVRDFDKKIFTNVDPMGEILWDENIYSGDRPKQKSGLRVASAKKVFDRVTKIINLGKAQGTLYVVGN
jgi:aminoglycoside 3-N-acetyltransferase